MEESSLICLELGDNMASLCKNLDASKPALSGFQVFITKIALEITSVETKILKSLVRDLLPARVLDNVDTKTEKLPSLDLVERLQEYCLLSQNNLNVLKQALEITGRADLVQKIDRFEETVTELRDAPPSQMAILPAPNTVFLRLLLGDPKRSEELTQRTNSLREAVCKKLELNLKDVAFVTKEGASLQDCVFIVFQFPNLEPKIMELNCDALNKASWLVNLGVLQLQIGAKASINIEENLQEIRPIPKRQTSILAVNPSFVVHQDDALDIILGIEFSHLVSENVSSQLLQQCQSALDTIRQPRDGDGFDMNLGVVTYSNHCSTLQPIAFASEGISKNFDVMKNEKQCLDGQGCSGIADAMGKVLELSKDVRKEASKVCILFTFLNQKSCDPEHYRCSHGNDIMKHCYALARSGITLYIIGINTAQSPLNGENHFLSGVATLGGGLFLQADDLSSLNQIIACIIKHDVSIEKQAKDTCKVLIDEINRKFGIVNINHLARYLKQILNKKAIGMDSFRQNGVTLTASFSQIAQRVSIADDLEDAISAVQSMSKRFMANANRKRNQDNLRLCSNRTKVGLPSFQGETFAEVSMETCIAEGNLGSKTKSDIFVDDLPEKDGNRVYLVENEEVDLEVASRMVRRLVHRLEYQKVDEEQE